MWLRGHRKGRPAWVSSQMLAFRWNAPSLGRLFGKATKKCKVAVQNPKLNWKALGHGVCPRTPSTILHHNTGQQVLPSKTRQQDNFCCSAHLDVLDTLNLCGLACQQNGSVPMVNALAVVLVIPIATRRCVIITWIGWDTVCTNLVLQRMVVSSKQPSAVRGYGTMKGGSMPIIATFLQTACSITHR